MRDKLPARGAAPSDLEDWPDQRNVRARIGEPGYDPVIHAGTRRMRYRGHLHKSIATGRGALRPELITVYTALHDLSLVAESSGLSAVDLSGVGSGTKGAEPHSQRVLGALGEVRRLLGFAPRGSGLRALRWVLAHPEKNIIGLAKASGFGDTDRRAQRSVALAVIGMALDAIHSEVAG